MSNHRLSFRIGKSSEVKFYAPVIIEALNRNIEVFLFCGPNPTKSFSKNPLERPLPININFPNKNKVKFFYYEDISEVTNLIKKHKITDFITLNFSPQTFNSYLPNIHKITRLHCLQATGDFLYTLPNSLNYITSMLMYSSKMIDLYVQSYPEIKNSPNLKKFIIVGNPIYDVIKSFNREKILRKYKVPFSSKKIVLLFSANPHINFWRKFVFGLNNPLKATIRCLLNSHPLFIKDIFFNQNYKKIIKEIKNWCNQNNAILIVKNKLKHQEPTYIKETADIMIEEKNNWYPYQTLELISISDLAISFNYSTSSIDSNIGNIPSIQIVINDPSLKESATSNYFSKSNLYHNPNTHLISNHKKFIKFLKTKKISDFKINPSARQSLIEDYAGPYDFQASKRIVDYITKNS